MGNLSRQIDEMKYTTVERAGYYRYIVRFLVEQYEKRGKQLSFEEIYVTLKENPYFYDYSELDLQNDLKKLVEWGNLIPRQEVGNYQTVQEFRRKRFRYQCTQSTVIIERMIIQLEQAHNSFGGSLESKLVQRLYESLIKLLDSEGLELEEIHQRWRDLFSYFDQLTQSSTDYLSYVDSEELMMSEQFLNSKNKFAEYLRNFVTGLQYNSARISSILQEANEQLVSDMVSSVLKHRMAMPRFDSPLDPVHTLQSLTDQWGKLKHWYLGSDGYESELYHLLKETDEVIRRITRLAQQFGERQSVRSRKTEFLHFAELIRGCSNIQEAHRFASCILGVNRPKVILGPKGTLSESPDTDIWDPSVSPDEIILQPKNRSYKPRTKPGHVVDHKEQRMRTIKETLILKDQQRKWVNEIIGEGVVRVRDLSIVNTFVRKTVLSWIAKSMADGAGAGRTDDGRKFRVTLLSSNRVILRCEDGSLEMPDYEIRFEEKAYS